MGRGFGMAVLLVMAVGTFGHAEVYRCKGPGGTVIFTDSPARGEECQVEQVEQVESLPPASSVPAEVRRPASGAGAGAESAAEAGAKSLESYTAEASGLVEQFNATRHKMVYAVLTGEKLEARRELAEIRAKKDVLLDEIDRSALSGAEQDRLRELLAPITE